MEKPKFEINEPKKFEINTPKKFEVNNSEWFQQQNSNDCGPCLALNALNELNIPVTEQSIEEVRDRVNELRANSDPLAPTGWFRTSDIGRYLSEKGLGIDEYTARPFEKVENLRTIKQIFDERSFDFIYITLGSHFKGIINKEGRLILLDSFNSGPQVIDNDSAWNLIANTINSSNGNRVEVVGIVKKDNPGYRLA